MTRLPLPVIPGLMNGRAVPRTAQRAPFMDPASPTLVIPGLTRDPASPTLVIPAK